MNPPSSEIAEPPPWLRWSLRLAVVVPIVVAAIRAVATGWFPVGDSALLAIRAYDVGTSHHPLLGSWTSASLTLGTDVNNPGPLYPDLLAPFMWTFGRLFGIGTGVAIGVAAVNTGFALAIAWVGDRLGGWRVERWALLMVGALTWAMGSELLIDIWQPHALLLPFACFLMLTVGLIDGHWRLLPGWIFVASLIVQTHIGYVYVLAVLGVVVVVHAVVRIQRDRVNLHDVGQQRTTYLALGVAGLAWIQPVIEQISGEGRGNLLRLASNAGGGDVTIGPGTAVKLVARVVVLPPWWTRFGFEDSVTSTPLTSTAEGPQLMVPGLPGGPLALLAVAVLIGLLASLLVLLRRKGATLPAAAVLVSLVGVLAGVATLTIQTVSIVGLGSHHVRWLFVLSLFIQISVGWAIVELAVPRRFDPHVAAGVVVLVAVLCIANLGYEAHDLGPTADRAAADTLERTFVDLERFEPGGPVRYDVSNLRPFEAWSSAVQMRMRELGIDFRVDDGGVVRQLGNARRVDGSEITSITQIERGRALTYDGPGCVISRASPLDAAGEAAVDLVIDAAVVDLRSGRIEIEVEGLGDGLGDRIRAAIDGNDTDARELVADGVLTFLWSEDRIATSSPAIDAAIDDAAMIERRVVGTLILVADPPVGCP